MWAAIAAVYILAFPYHPGLRSPNELSRLWQSRAIVEFGELDLNRTMRIYGAVGDLSIFNGRYYPSKAPLMSVAGVPIYAALRAVLGGTQNAVSELAQVYFSRLCLTVFPTLVLLILLRRFLRAYATPVTADAVVITYAMGTLAFSYSLLFMSHQPSAVLLFGSFYGLWRWSRGEWPEARLLISGALASAAVVAEYTTVVGVLGLVLFAAFTLRERGLALWNTARAGVLFVCGAIPLTLMLMWYHTRVFGGPLETGYRHLADVAYQPWHQGGFLGIGLPQPKALLLSFFSPLRGLFTLSPSLLLAIPGLVLLFGRARGDRQLRPLAWATLGIALGYSYFTSAFSYESWGWTTGPRHLTALVPVLLLPCAVALDRARTTWLRGACGVLLASSVVITSALTFVNYIPDNVSNSFLALGIPLPRLGYFSPNVLCALGFPNSVAGAILWVAVASNVCWLLWAFSPDRSALALLSTLLAVAAIVCFQWATYLDSAADRSALSLLRRVWLTPPGETLILFGRQ